MLMKQVWGLASKRSSSWTQWIKERYLRNDSFWTRKIPASCSISLRSIFQTREYAVKYVRHFIGEGSTFFWTEPWHFFGVLWNKFSPGTLLSQAKMTTISQVLFGHAGRPPESFPLAALTLLDDLRAAPKLQPTEKDKIIWTATASGEFSTKSAWHTLRKHWPLVYWAKLIWFKETTPRHAFIFWLACRHALNTKEKLANLGIIQDAGCVLCKSSIPESLQHLFFSCEYSQRIWAAAMLSNRLRLVRTNTWDQTICWFLAHARGNSFACRIRTCSIAATIYYLRIERNNRIFKAQERGTRELIAEIMNWVRKKFMKQIVDDNTKNREVAGHWNIELEFCFRKHMLCKWCPPNLGYFAINCDGSLAGELGGSGIIIRNHAGEVLKAKALTMQGISIIFHEMIAIREGLYLAASLGLRCLEVQSDSKLAVESVQGKKRCPWQAFWVVSQIKSIVTCFEDVNFKFVYRQSNKVADFLASHLSYIGEVILNVHDIPNELWKIVQVDVRDC